MKCLAGAAVFSLLASAASASTLSLTYQGATSAGDEKNVTIQAAPVVYPGSGNWPKTVGAWGFNMSDSTGGLGNFIAWCLDVGSFLSTSSSNAAPYSVTSTPFSNSYGLSTAEQGRVQSLFDANYHSIDITSGNQAAGFQLALWDALYDGDGDVSAGTFRATASTAIVNFANNFFGAATSYSGGKQFNLTFLESEGTSSNGKYQNLVTVSPVPIPAAGALLLLALGGLGLVGRRLKRS
jgi:hypothetical protein